MANHWFTSDLHLGHKNIHNFRTMFSSAEEHHEVILDNILSKVTKRDKLTITGDVCFSEEWIKRLADTNLNIQIVLGNHDTDRHTDLRHWAKYFDLSCFHSLVKYKNYWLSHAPLHPDELRGKFNLHGHTHYSTIDDPRYLNLCLEQHDYYPIDLNQIREHFKNLNK